MQLTKKAYEIIADDLRNRIHEGNLKPGEKLATIDNLAKQFYVGKSTIREALSILKAEGLIESVQGDGTYVSSHSVEHFSRNSFKSLGSVSELRELLQVRKVLEVGTIGLAAVHRTSEDLQELRRIVEEMRSAIGNEELSQIHDVSFHRAIARATQNRILAGMMENLSSTMMRTIRDTRKLWLCRERESAANLFEEHERMYTAISTQDTDDAVEVMRLHLERVEDAFRSLMEAGK
ncbi:FadR/GntR family transcriptional regulator [Alicyclobacillus dauci]|uniref:FadR family transcriptional regulator n=1 Tax=Alicyclobacillus dauci TaxID=1475485 RepID=A0ABY6Z2P3_9BACL|nr:FadR/GntR family transcriptional regulator [Alicyclobacillus dauci]WAH37174.1 FadR family transcriptional regulator [Alicyclobacillus dauci]